MRARSCWFLLLMAGMAAPPVPGQSLPELTEALDEVVRVLAPTGAGLGVVRRDQIVHFETRSPLGAKDALPIDAAGQWLAAATALAAADAGIVDLDVPVGRYLPAFARADKQAITLRLCLANTAGLQAEIPGLGNSRDLGEMAQRIAQHGLRSEPLTEFHFSPVSLQVVACALQQASGKGWHDLFRELIAAPLGLRDTAFGTAEPRGGGAGTTPVPWLATGAVSSLTDLARFVGMLANRGTWSGRVILSTAAVASMFADQDRSGRLRVASPVFAGREVRYGIAAWLEHCDRDGCGGRAWAPGATGWTLWLDPDVGVGGVFVGGDLRRPAVAELAPLQDVARDLLTEAAHGTDREVELRHDGRRRSYLLHVPPRAELAQRLGWRLPLMLVLHGGGGNGRQIADATEFSPLADQEGFVVAYPDGTGRLRNRLLTWNSGGIPVYAAEQDIDDVGFLQAVVADVAARLPVDPDRVYAAGMSNGGMMAHRLARAASDTFAAVAVVAGAMNHTGDVPDRPVAVLIIHGTADRHVRYEGGAPLRSTGRAGDREDAAVATARDFWIGRNDLAPTPEVQQQGKVRIETWQRHADGSAAPAPVQVVTLEGGGHAWPGGARGRYPGADEPFPWPATRHIWDFVQERRRLPR